MTFALGIRYLNGWAMATHPSDRNRAEWPPHPDRVFMALAAAFFETGEDPSERAALEWLEKLPPPALAASATAQRTMVTSYVPVNDIEITRPDQDSPERLGKRLAKLETVASYAKARDAGLAVLPDFRSRQPRTFAVAVPDDPTVHLIWDGVSCPAPLSGAMTALCAKVICIGHSASLVQMWMETAPPPPTLYPTNKGLKSATRLRVSVPGRLQALQDRHAREQRLGRKLSTAGLWVGYGAPAHGVASASAVLHSFFDHDLLILRKVQGSPLGLESTLQLTQTLRDAVMKHCPQQPPPEWISGHRFDGSPSQKPHLACIPLAYVGHEHADGHMLGVAIVLPRDVTPDDQRDGLGQFLFDSRSREVVQRTLFSGVWEWGVILEDREARPLSLKPETWTGWPGGSRRWASVTPIVFDRHPKNTGDGEATVAAACERIGLPRPQTVVLSSVSPFIGACHARNFPLMERKTGGHLQQQHAVLTFDQAVLGPVLLGAGRYKGYGLCQPLHDGGAS